MFSFVTARSATIVAMKLEEALTWAEFEIAFKKLNQWTVCRELSLFRSLESEKKHCTVG